MPPLAVQPEGTRTPRRLGPDDLAVAALVGAAFTASPLTGAARLGPSLVAGGLAAGGYLAAQRRRPRPPSPGLIARVPALGWLVIALASALMVPSALGLFAWYSESIWRNAHGMVLPLVIAGLTARTLRRTAELADDGTAWGFAPLLLGVGLLVADSGVHTLQLASLGISFLLLGMSLLFLGKRRTLALSLPLGLTLFLMPIPTMITSYFELQSSSLAGADLLLDAVGMPAIVSTTKLILPGNQYAISANCSGFSALYAGVTAAVVLGVHSRSWARTLLLLLAVWPAVVVFNSVRVAATVLVCERFGIHLLHSPLHGISGILTVLAVLACLHLLAGPRALRNTYA